jgi:sulfur transfer protein SufE
MQSKIDRVNKWFAHCTTPAERYEQIISLGREHPALPQKDQIPTNRVTGCQSTLYLKTTLSGNKLIFETQADALISSGLAILLTAVLSGETPEMILTFEPTYLTDLGIPASLSPSRANGLASLHLRMKQEALKALTNPSSGLGPSEVQRNFVLDTTNSEESCSRRSTGDEEDVVDEAKGAEIQGDESRARVD